MAKSSSLSSKSREIIISSSHEELATFISQLFMPRETEEYRTAKTLYNYCVDRFGNCLTLKLLYVYQCSSADDALRIQTIYLLSETIEVLRNKEFEFSLAALKDIKPLVIYCLTMRETKELEINILGRIVSFIAYDVVSLDNGGWDELSDCIFSLLDKEPLKALHVFNELPPLYERFIDRFLQKILAKVEKMLLNPMLDRVEDYSLALETVVKLGIQILDADMSVDLIKRIISVLVKSAIELVEKGMEEFLLQGLESLENFLSRDKISYNYNKNQCNFVSDIAFKIEGIGKHTKQVARKINRLVESSPTTLVQPQKVLENHGAELDSTLSSLEVLRIFESNDTEDNSREMAIRRLNDLLSDHTLKKVKIDIDMMRQLQPLLISCLEKKGISDSMLKVLGEVVNHVAYEMFSFQKVTWFSLRDYIASQSKTEFERAVYIFQCLTMQIKDEDFVTHVMKNLLPEISSRLNSPRDLLVDNRCWVLAFMGAFCAVIHLIEIPSHGEYIKEIANKMVGSVRELVKRGMEVGVVRRAFRDLESIVKKQLGWYGTSEYRFVKGLLWRFYEIKSMKMESKLVLWRINVILESEVAKQVKELPRNEFDWINQPFEAEELCNLKF